MIICWGALFIIWIITWANNARKKKKTYPLHYFFVLFGILWFIYSIFEEKYWIYFSKYGYPPIDLSKKERKK